MEKKYILQSVNFYLAVKNLMRRYDYNSFIISCFELCVKKVPA